MKELKMYLIKPLILIGALNWGFIGMFNYDVIGAIFAQNEVILRIIDSAIGLAAVVFIVMMFFWKKEK
jgi:uncharacterized membrane protein YuzA (DUF378 family)